MREFGIFPDLETNPQELDFFFGEGPYLSRYFGKVRQFPYPYHHRRGGQTLKNEQDRIRGKEIGWNKGPGANNIANIPKASRNDGGPWTRRNNGPPPPFDEE